jgi:hypothetical protein
MTSFRIHLLFVAFAMMIFSSCNEDLTGSANDLDPSFSNSCSIEVRDYLKFDMPCHWEVIDNHEEEDQIGVIRTGEVEVYFQFGTFDNLASVIQDETNTYYYPLLDGTMIFIVSEIHGRQVISGYFESVEQEGGTVTLEFWFAPKDDGKLIMNVLRTLIIA